MVLALRRWSQGDHVINRLLSTLFGSTNYSGRLDNASQGGDFPEHGDYGRVIFWTRWESVVPKARPPLLWFSAIRGLHPAIGRTWIAFFS
jgi:hypothetical protein